MKQQTVVVIVVASLASLVLLLTTRRGKRDNFSGLAEALGWSGVMSDRIAELAWTTPCRQPCRTRGFCTPGRAKYNKGLCCKGPWASRGFCSRP